MVALNNLGAAQKRQHLETIKGATEELIITAALHAGVNPNSIDPATHPAPNSFDPDAEDYDQLDVNLAERVLSYNNLVAKLDAL